MNFGLLYGDSSNALPKTVYSDVGFFSQCFKHQLQPRKFIYGQLQLGSRHHYRRNLIDAKNAVGHACRTQIVKRNRAECTVDVAHKVLRGNKGGSSLCLIHFLHALSYFAQALPDLPISIFHNYRDCLGTSFQAQLISLRDEPSGVCILPAHHEYRHSQCSDRADRLNPARPGVFCQARIVSNGLNKHRTSGERSSKKYIEKEFLHESIQSCLKGILA